MTTPAPVGFAQLLARARALAGRGSRQLLGVTGAPGAGKSTLAERLVAALGPAARLVPMDGFHLAQAELRRLGRADRKGAPTARVPLATTARIAWTARPWPRTAWWRTCLSSASERASPGAAPRCTVLPPPTGTSTPR